ncbi:MAG: short-chain dehydrogenase [Mycobacterium sp.]|nr:short-chain dehydrogenase [Mycobacterium sp.]
MTAINGSTAVVTGGQRGLGKALAAQLLSRGAAKVCATARRPHESGSRPADTRGRRAAMTRRAWAFHQKRSNPHNSEGWHTAMTARVGSGTSCERSNSELLAVADPLSRSAALYRAGRFRGAACALRPPAPRSSLHRTDG